MGHERPRARALSQHLLWLFSGKRVAHRGCTHRKLPPGAFTRACQLPLLTSLFTEKLLIIEKITIRSGETEVCAGHCSRSIEGELDLLGTSGHSNQLLESISEILSPKRDRSLDCLVCGPELLINHSWPVCSGAGRMARTCINGSSWPQQKRCQCKVVLHP